MDKLDKIRYFPPKLLDELFVKNNITSNLDIIGKSVLNNPIYSLKIGSGDKKVLMWSQMHGNETTTTKALFDFYDFLMINIKGRDLIKSLTFYIIFQLNPDGAYLYTRNNANGIDLNRDALCLIEPESRLLIHVFNTFEPDFCFNLHGQRSIYSVGESNIPSTISFLAPSASYDKKETQARRIAMQLISVASNEIIKEHSSLVARFDDSFNLNCFGDFFTKKRVPTILFEAGHYLNDYYRSYSRKLIFKSLVRISESIINRSYLKIDHTKYYEIPVNNNDLRDIIIKNVSVLNDKGISTNQEIAIQFKEELVRGRIHFTPLIESMGSNLLLKSSSVYILTKEESLSFLFKYTIGDNAEKIINRLNLIKNI